MRTFLFLFFLFFVAYLLPASLHASHDEPVRRVTIGSAAYKVVSNESVSSEGPVDDLIAKMEVAKLVSEIVCRSKERAFFVKIADAKKMTTLVRFAKDQAVGSDGILNGFFL
ncbi:MAG: hypothetical protein PVJ92_01940 [Candidatus Dependentiae bacterium]|jgi:hypothetical protein